MDLMFRHGKTPTQRLMWLKRLSGGGGSSVLKTVTGTLLHILDALAKPAVSFEVGIEPQQDLHGQDAPYPSGGGVNKLDPSQAMLGTDSLYGLATTWSTDGVLTLIGTWTGGTSGSARILNVPSAVRSLNVKGFESSGHISLRWQSGEDRIVADCANMVNGNSYNLTVYPIVYEGSTAPTAWSPYSNICPITGWTGVDVYQSGEDTSNPTTIPITFPDAAGTVYGGTLTNEGGEWKLRAIKGKRLLTKNDISAVAVEGNNTRVNVAAGILGIFSQYGNGVCNKAKFTTSWASCGSTTNGIAVNNPASNQFIVNKSIGTTLQEIKDSVGDDGLEICAELATPVTYTLTSQQAMTLLKGENNIWTDVNGTLSLTYYADGRASTSEALGILLGGAYNNPQGADDVSDREALQIILGETT